MHLQEKLSQEFFTRIENKIMEEINGNMAKSNASWTADGQFTGHYIQVDVKVNDFFLPEWLKLSLEAMRKKRGVKKV